jgi:uncharacterized protein YggE
MEGRLEMKRKFMVITLVGLVAIGVAQVYADDNARISTIAVSGEAKISVDPDMAIVTFGIEYTAKQPKEVQNSVNGVADNVIAAMLQSGIAKSEIRTNLFTVYPVYSSKPSETNKITGYRGTNSLTVTLHDVSQVGLIVDKAVAAGANKVQSVRYMKQAESDLRDEVLGKAVADAVDKAKTIATALGRTLGKVLTVDNAQASMNSPDEAAMFLKAAAAQPDGFSPGTLELSASISILFELD